MAARLLCSISFNVYWLIYQYSKELQTLVPLPYYPKLILRQSFFSTSILWSLRLCHSAPNKHQRHSKKKHYPGAHSGVNLIKSLICNGARGRTWYNQMRSISRTSHLDLALIWLNGLKAQVSFHRIKLPFLDYLHQHLKFCHLWWSANKPRNMLFALPCLSFTRPCDNHHSHAVGA